MLARGPALEGSRHPVRAESGNCQMRRLVHTSLGVAFVLIGTVLVGGFSSILFRYDFPAPALLGVAIGAIGLMLGVAAFTVFAYDVSAYGEAIHLSFPFFTSTVPLTEIEWYRKVGVTWGFETAGPHVNAGIFVIL